MPFRGATKNENVTLAAVLFPLPSQRERVRVRVSGPIFKAAIAVLVFTVFATSFFPSPHHIANAQPLPPAKSRAKYSMVVDLDYQSASLAARESVVFINNTPVDLGSVVFNVVPAHFKAFALNGVLVDGKKASPTIDGMVMEVPLPATLLKGESTTIELDFRVSVPKRGGRFGTGDGIIALGNWFPVVAVYNSSRISPDQRPIGWSTSRYVDVGDAFYSETADYDVVVKASSPVTIAHTGILVNREGNNWQFRADDVRDFALAISNRYQTRSRSVDGVTITAFYLPGQAQAGPQYLEAAAQALAGLSRAVMPYPYPTLHIAEIYSQDPIAQGQEYPNLVFVSSTASDLGGGIDSYLSYVVMHEVAHQWFYGLVGNDQVYQPWMDEAMATWYSYHLLRSVAPNLLPAVWQKRLLDPLEDSIKRHGDSPVDKDIYDFSDEMHYYNIVYKKGALFIEELYMTMGQESFFDAMKEYATTFRDRIATPIAFFDLFQSRTSKDLSPIIARYFSFERYRAGEPLKVSVDFPPGQVWSGIVKPKIAANQPVTNVSLLIEDHVVSTGAKADAVAVDIAMLRPGEEYVLTVRVRAGGQIAERVRRFEVQGEPAKGAGAVDRTGTPIVPPSKGTQNGSTEAQSGSAWLWASVIGALILLLGLTYSVRRTR